LFFHLFYIVEFSFEAIKEIEKFFLLNFKTSFFLSYYWNFGSLILIIFGFQIFSGLFLVLYYSNSFEFAFFSIQYLIFEVNFGWFIRLLHFNLVSFFFLIVFFHFLKGLFFFSYRLKGVWFFGVLIFLFLIIVSFLGYVLVWAQMSFWAGVVIIRLLSVIPFFGLKLMFFVWGSFLFGGGALKIFFFLHFILPFFIFFFILLHVFFLHFYGRTNFFFLNKNFFKVKFFPFYWLKDFFNFFFIFIFFLFLLKSPFVLGDSLIFEEVNNLVSPIHIVPEWYFLFVYAILRAIPNKILGVFFLLIRILSFLFFLFYMNYKFSFDIFNKFLLWFFVFCFIFLGFLGCIESVFPFVFLGFLFFIFYFILIFLLFFNYLISFLLFFFYWISHFFSKNYIIVILYFSLAWIGLFYSIHNPPTLLTRF
jgi:ubiquinol-cytochrome c reductase cytochrome b subunit